MVAHNAAQEKKKKNRPHTQIALQIENPIEHSVRNEFDSQAHVMHYACMCL